MVHAARPVFTLMIDLTRNLTDVRTRRETSQLGKILEKVVTGNPGERPSTTLPDLPRASSLINDNYYVTQFQTGLLAGSTSKRKTIDTCFVNLNVVTRVPTVPGHSQRKDLSPGPVECYSQRDHSLKYVKGVSCVLCPFCSKCKKCCIKTSCRGKTSKLLAGLAGPGCRSEGDPNFERGLYPSISEPAKVDKTSHSRKLLCQSSQEQLPVRGIASAYRQKCCRTSAQADLSRVLQPTVFGSQTQQQMEANLGLKPIKSFPQSGEIQDGNTGNHQNIPPTRRMGHLGRFQRCILPYPNTGTVQEISQVSCPGSDIPIQSLAFRSVHSTHGVHCIGKGGEADGRSQGYKNPPVPRRLVSTGQIIPYLPPAYSKFGRNVSSTRMAGEHRKIGAGAEASFQFCRLPVRPQVQPGQTDTGPVAQPTGQNTNSLSNAGLSGPAVYVPDRSTDSHGKTSSSWPATHEAYSVAPQKQLEDTGIPGEDYPSTQVPAPTLAMVARGRQRATRSAVTPGKACSANIYRRIKRRVGCSLKRAHCKRVLVGAGKPASHKLSRVKSGFSHLKRVPRPLYRQDGTGSNRQHHSGVLYKQRGRHEVGPLVCPTMENPDLVFPETGDSKSTTHTRTPKCDSGQAIQTGADHPDRVVPPSRGFSKHMRDMAPTSNRSVCHEVQPQITSVCVSSTGPSGCSSGCTHSAMGGSGCICLPTDRHLGQSGGETIGHPVQKVNSNCSGMAQHALVLGLGDHVQSNSSQLAKSAQSVDTALQSDPSQKSDKPKSPCMAPRATAIKEQGFSEAVAARIEAPQRRSTRSVYEAKWSISSKWCIRLTSKHHL